MPTDTELENIHYRLDLQTSFELTSQIVKTVSKLPEDVIDFVIEKIQFIEGKASMFHDSDIEKPFIVILRKNNSFFTIAHEIAHAYLRHHTEFSVNAEHNRQHIENNEKEANKQARKWLRGD